MDRRRKTQSNVMAVKVKKIIAILIDYGSKLVLIEQKSNVQLFGGINTAFAKVRATENSLKKVKLDFNAVFFIF